MMDDKKYVPFMRSYYDALKELPRSARANVVLSILEYAFEGTTPILTGAAKMAFILIQPTLDKSEEMRKTVKARWDKKKEATYDTQNNTAYHTQTDKTYDTQNDTSSPNKEKENGERRTEKDIAPYSPPRGTGRLPAPRFVPPSVDDVHAYCEQRRNGVDPEQFVNFYASKGWKVGSSPMKDWKAAVRTWEQRDGRGPGTADKPKTNNPFLAMALEMEDEA